GDAGVVRLGFFGMWAERSRSGAAGSAVWAVRGDKTPAAGAFRPPLRASFSSGPAVPLVDVVPLETCSPLDPFRRRRKIGSTKIGSTSGDRVDSRPTPPRLTVLVQRRHRARPDRRPRRDAAGAHARPPVRAGGTGRDHHPVGTRRPHRMALD